VEYLESNVVNLTKFAKHAQILKNSVASRATAGERIFLMKDPTAVEKAAGLGGRVMEWNVGI